MNNQFDHTSLREPGHKYACKCETCMIVIRNIVWFRQWHDELSGACVVDHDGNCVGCINCALENAPAIR